MKRIVHGILSGKLMQREIPYRVILPKDYDVSEKNYPVVYLLHGLFGSCDNWLDLTGITDYLDDKELIAVLVEGGNSWYIDSKAATGNKFGSYIIKELIPEIENSFRTINKRESRAIVGLSMGGYGAFKFALKSDLFTFAGSMSGAFDAPHRSIENPGFDWEILSPSILEAFGEENSLARTENDLFLLIKEIPAEKINRLPYFYFDCGLEDGFLEINRKLAKLLREKNIDFEFHEVSGGHDWDYWDKQIKKILRIVENRLSTQEN